MFKIIQEFHNSSHPRAVGAYATGRMQQGVCNTPLHVPIPCVRKQNKKILCLRKNLSKTFANV